MKKKFYVVWKGKEPGVYSSWEKCKKTIDGFEGALYKSFSDELSAKKAYAESPYIYMGAAAKKPVMDISKGAPNLNSISVDAACSGNPGLMEYRCVETRTKREIFHQGPYPNGTNNIGEFLALVHALAWSKQKGYHTLPIYTDSMTALSWVQNKKAKTKLEATSDNEVLFDLIERAETWLKKNNTWKNPILKWDTKNWGEIPADFGRK
ncbi:MAG: ribonuclease H family protein [Bacteroidota bacterium]